MAKQGSAVSGVSLSRLSGVIVDFVMMFCLVAFSAGPLLELRNLLCVRVQCSEILTL